MRYGWGQQLHQVLGNAVGGVAGYSGLLQIVPDDGGYAQLLDGVQVGHDLGGGFERVLRF